VVTEKDNAMNKQNVIAAIVIAVVMVGGAAALYHLDTGQGHRTSQSISAKTASD
jgi:hypothetical protein